MWNTGFPGSIYNSPLFRSPFGAQAPGLDPLTQALQQGAQSFGFSPFDAFERGSSGFGGQMANNPMAMMVAMLQQQMMLMMLADLLVNFGGQQGQGQGRGGCMCQGGMPNGGGWGASRRTGGAGWGNNGGTSSVGGNAPLPSGSGNVNDFLQQALAQNGKRYVFGAEASANNANPGAFDCSELVEWAAARAGVTVPDGSNNQRDFVRRNGMEISVDQALRTPGALLFRDGHVAISLGDGRTIEARGRNYGVGIFNGQGRFTSGGLIPGMNYAGAAGQNVAAGPTGNNTPAGPTGQSATAQQLNRQLGGVFAGQGQAFVNAAQRHGLDPALLAAIAMHETGNGTSNAVRTKNNVGGLMDPRTNWSTLQRFSSVEAGLDAMASNLKRNYIDKGLTSFDAIGRKYAPVGAANDPTGLNRHWVTGVSRYYQGLTG